MTRVAGLNQHPLLFTEHLSSLTEEQSPRRSRARTVPVPRLSGWLSPRPAVRPGSYPRRTSEMSGSHCGITPRPCGALPRLCSSPVFTLSKDRGPELLPFSPPMPRAPAAQVGHLLPGAASGQCLGRASSERERVRKGVASRAGCGPDCHGLVIYTTGQQVVYTEGFLGPSGSSSVIYVRICKAQASGECLY